MSEKLKAKRASLEEFYGVDGDGLGEGEVSCQEELENEIFTWSPRGRRADVRQGQLVKTHGKRRESQPEARQRSLGACFVGNGGS